MIDDDMAFNANHAQAVINASRQFKAAVSAAYILGSGMLAAEKVEGDRWLTGLGFLAVPVVQLEALAENSPKFKAARTATEETIGFTAAGVWHQSSKVWEPEDYCFTRRLGGVILLKMFVGHVKPKVMIPDMTKIEGATEMPTNEPPKC